MARGCIKSCIQSCRRGGLGDSDLFSFLDNLETTSIRGVYCNAYREYHRPHLLFLIKNGGIFVFKKGVSLGFQVSILKNILVPRVPAPILISFLLIVLHESPVICNELPSAPCILKWITLCSLWISDAECKNWYQGPSRKHSRQRQMVGIWAISREIADNLKRFS